MAIEPIFNALQIAQRVEELGREIRAAAGDEEVFLLGILKGAAVFTADLLRAIDGQVRYGFIDVFRDQVDTETAAAIEIDFISHMDIRGRNVFVAKDVVSTGVIETYLLAQLRNHAPKSLRLVALIDRPELRTVDLRTDFRAFELSGGAFAGYGLEIDGHYGNLPFIGRTAK